MPASTSHAARINALAVGAVLTLLAILSGCGESIEKLESRVQKAEAYRTNGKIMASVIELRNAIYEHPDAPRPHYMLGLIHVEEAGDGESGTSELLRARELGFSEDKILRPLALSRILQGEPVQALELIDRVDLTKREDRATLLALRGDAYRRLRKWDKANEAYRQALLENSASTTALVGAARAALENGHDISKAQSFLEMAKVVAPTDRDIRLLAGDLDFERGNYEQSEQILAPLAKAYKVHAPTRMSLAKAQIALGKYAAAVANLDDAFGPAPYDPNRNYLRALAAYQAADYAAAKQYAETVLQIQERNIPARIIAAASSYATQNFEAAKLHLDRYFDGGSDSHLARRLYGSVLLRLGRVNEAREMLKPLIGDADKDAALLSMIGAAALSGGDFEAAREYLDRAIELRPDQQGLKAQIGLARIGLGNADEGLEEIPALRNTGTSATAAAAALFLKEFRAKEYIAAINAARELQRLDPDNPLGPTLIGVARLRLNDLAGAREALEQALRMNGNFVAALANMGALERATGNLAEARKIYSKLLGLRPDHLIILIRMAEIENRQGNPEAALGLLEQAASKHPKAAEPKVALTRLLLESGRSNEAVAVGARAREKHPESKELLEVLSYAQFQAGRFADAANSLKELVRIGPDTADLHFRLAQAYQGIGNTSLARIEIGSTIVLDSNHVPARLALAQLLLDNGELASARREIGWLKERAPRHPAVLTLLGDLAMIERRPDAAIEAYSAARRIVGDSNLVIRLARAQWATGDTEAALKGMADWLARFSADGLVRAEYGSFLLELDRAKEALSQLSLVVDQMPKDARVRNNLAWAMHRTGNGAVALYHAERALELSGKNPGVMDTLAVILLAQDRTPEALKLLRDAAKLAPQMPAIRYHLAQALAAGGQRTEAKAILQRLLAEDGSFAERADAERFLLALGQ